MAGLLVWPFIKVRHIFPIFQFKSLKLYLDSSSSNNTIFVHVENGFGAFQQLAVIVTNSICEKWEKETFKNIFFNLNKWERGLGRGNKKWEETIESKKQ